MSTDTQIAREWASKALDSVFLNEVPIEGYRAAARHILATTTPPTMADIAWDDEVHAGLCAEHPEYGLVRMLSMGKKLIECLLVDGEILFLLDYDLTPIPGTRLDLTPRRESVPESTPEQPVWVSTEEDYESAPTGTIVAGDYADPWVKDYMGFWLACSAGESETSQEMALAARRVLRRGETL